MDFAHFWFQQTGGPAPHLIGNSLRFRGAQYLRRAWTTARTDNRKHTISFWLKKSQLGAHGVLLSGTSETDDNSKGNLVIINTDQVRSGNDINNSYRAHIVSNARLRDPAAWYHIVVAYDSTLLSGKRVRLYLNGVEQDTTGQQPDQNEGSNILGANNSFPTRIGQEFTHGVQGTFEGYISEVIAIDGVAHYDPTLFGEFNAEGAWVPKEVTGLVYGNHGFHLDFADVTQIGKDVSGNNNHFTPTGFELTDTTSTNYDWMADSPTDNFSTLNPLDKHSSTNAINANLGQDTPGGTWAEIGSTISFDTGSYYFEAVMTRLSGSGTGIGVTRADVQCSNHSATDATRIVFHEGGSYEVGNFGVTKPANTAGYAVGDVVGVLVNADAGTLEFRVNGASRHTFTSTQLATYVLKPYLSAHTSSWAINFGQRPFAHQPAGFLPLSTAGLPNVAITNPSEHFTTILDTGANILTNAQAQVPNGLWWIKDRANANQHQLVDSVRGGNLALQCPASGQETAYVAPAGNSVAWCWSAPDTFTGAGTIPSTGRRNTAAGFSIVQYTGVAPSGGDVAHGLSQSPEFIIAKRSAISGGFVCWHKDLPGADTDKFIYLESTASAGVTSGYWGSGINATTFGVWGTTQPGGSDNNSVGGAQIAYCWHSVPGYSSIGSYQGNNNADGPFIYTGFRPAWVMIKATNFGSGSWRMVDSSRQPYNVGWCDLVANRTDSEAAHTAGTSNQVDLLSNGFKLRDALSETNQNYTYIYCAFAEHPFGGGNVSPSPAR